VPFSGFSTTGMMVMHSMDFFDDMEDWHGYLPRAGNSFTGAGWEMNSLPSLQASEKKTLLKFSPNNQGGQRLKKRASGPLHSGGTKERGLVEIIGK